MANYKTNHGFVIRHRSSDPANPQEGEIWYNTTTQKLRVAPLLAGSWASGGNLNQARRYGGGTGTQTAGLAIGGYQPGQPNSGNLSQTEEYDGSSWTESGDLSTGRYNTSGIGIQTAALAAGGYSTTHLNNTEEYDGTSWTAGGDLNTSRMGHAGNFGSQTAGLMAGGFVSPGETGTDVVESYNGTSWSEVGDLNTARGYAGGSNQSPYTDGVIFGGGTSPLSGNLKNETETWDGTSWTETANLNSGRWSLGGGGTSSTAAIGFGGAPFTGKTEEWNGTSWTESADLAAGRNYLSGCGTTSLGLAFAGEPGPGASPTTSTEEWTKAVGARTIDVS